MIKKRKNKNKNKKKNVKEIKEEDEDEWETESEEENEIEETVNTSTKKNIKAKKEKGKDEENENEVADENTGDSDDNEEEVGPIVLPNGELLLENGETVGNKMYKVYYNQRLRVRRYEGNQRLMKIRNRAAIRERYESENKLKHKIRFNVVKDSNKSSFQRINTLFKARKQVNV